MAEFNPYKLEEEKWTPKNVYEILPPNAVSWSDYDFGQGTDNVDTEAANKSLIDGFADFFKELFGTAGQILGGAIELGGAILGGFVNGVIGLIGGIANAIGSIFGGGPSETPYPPMFSPIKANLEASIQPFKDQIEESKQKSEELLAEQLDIRGQIAEQVEITKNAVAEARAASAEAGESIERAEAASATAKEARETLEAYNTALNQRITQEFNSAVGRADTAVAKADTLAGELADFKAQASTDVEDALTKAQTASDELAALAPQVSDAVSKAGSAVDKANQTFTDYTAWAAAQKTRIDSAVSKAEKASSDLSAMSPRVDDAVSKANKASGDVSTLTPKVTAAQTRADNAYKEAENVRNEVTPKIEAAQSKGETALAAADKAIADSEFIAGFADDLIPKDAAGKSTWGSQLEPGDISPEESAFGSERTYIMSGSTKAPEPFAPVKGQEVYRLTLWLKEHPDSTNGGFSFHLRSSTGYAGWTHVRMNFGQWQTKDERPSPYATISDERWEKYTIDFRWPESAGPAYPLLAQNTGGKFYVHDLQVRVIAPVDNSVDLAQNDAIKALNDIARQQGEINEAQRVANLAQQNFNDNQKKWSDGVDVALATQKTVNDNFSKWTTGATTAIEANTKAIAALNAPDSGASLMPVNPLTNEPYYLQWAGSRADLTTLTGTPETVGVRQYSTEMVRYDAPSDGYVLSKLNKGTVYRWSVWVHSSAENSDIRFLLRDPVRGVSAKNVKGDEGVTVSNSSYGIILTKVPKGWSKQSGTIEFNDEANYIYLYAIEWNFTKLTVTQYFAGLDIYPDVPTQAQVDDAQNKAIESLGILTAKQKEWSDGAAKAIQANTDVAVALARINGIQVGGRNLLKKSDLNVSNNSYPAARADFGDSVPADGEEITISAKASLGAGKTSISFYNSGGSTHIASVPASERDSNGVYKVVTKWRSNSANTHVNVYPMPNSVTTTSKIEWVKLERGNQASDWTPAPEDLPTQKQVDDAQNDAISANTEALKALGKKALGASLVPYRTPSDQEVKDYAAGKLSYDPWADPEYFDAGHSTASNSQYGRYMRATPSQGTKSHSGTLVTVDSSIEYRIKFDAFASVEGSVLVVAMQDQNGSTAVQSTSVRDQGTMAGTSYPIHYLTLKQGWNSYSGKIKFKPSTTAARLSTFYWNHPNGVSTTQAFTNLEIVPDIPDANVVNLLQDQAILENTQIGKDNKKAIDALTEGLDAYAAAADLESLHKHLQDELEKEQDARADLAAEINNYMVESIPRTIIYNSGPQFNDHISAERYKIIAKPGWVGQMLIDVTYVSKSDGTQTKRVIENHNVPAPDGSREYSVPSASFGGYLPAYRLDYWVYRGKSVQKALSSSGSYITGSSFTKNTWTRIATHTIGKSNGAVHILWRTRLTRADRGVTYSFDVRVNGKSVLDKHYKGYGPLTGFGDGGATLSFSGNLSVPDNGKVEIYAKASGTTNQASVSSNKGTLTYLELEK